MSHYHKYHHNGQISDHGPPVQVLCGWIRRRFPGHYGQCSLILWHSIWNWRLHTPTKKKKVECIFVTFFRTCIYLLYLDLYRCIYSWPSVSWSLLFSFMTFAWGVAFWWGSTFCGNKASSSRVHKHFGLVNWLNLKMVNGCAKNARYTKKILLKGNHPKPVVPGVFFLSQTVEINNELYQRLTRGVNERFCEGVEEKQR